MNLFLDLIDDRVQTNIDVFLFGDFGSARLGSNVETDNYDSGLRIVRLRSRRQQHVRFGDSTDTGADNPNLDLVGRKFFEGSAQNFDRTLNVGFENNKQF